MATIAFCHITMSFWVRVESEKNKSVNLAREGRLEPEGLVTFFARQASLETATLILRSRVFASGTPC